MSREGFKEGGRAADWQAARRRSGFLFAEFVGQAAERRENGRSRQRW